MWTANNNNINNNINLLHKPPQDDMTLTTTNTSMTISASMLHTLLQNMSSIEDELKASIERERVLLLRAKEQTNSMREATFALETAYTTSLEDVQRYEDLHQESLLLERDAELDRLKAERVSRRLAEVQEQADIAAQEVAKLTEEIDELNTRGREKDVALYTLQQQHHQHKTMTRMTTKHQQLHPHDHYEKSPFESWKSSREQLREKPLLRPSTTTGVDASRKRNTIILDDDSHTQVVAPGVNVLGGQQHDQSQQHRHAAASLPPLQAVHHPFLSEFQKEKLQEYSKTRSGGSNNNNNRLEKKNDSSSSSSISASNTTTTHNRPYTVAFSSSASTRGVVTRSSESLMMTQHAAFATPAADEYTSITSNNKHNGGERGSGEGKGKVFTISSPSPSLVLGTPRTNALTTMLRQARESVKGEVAAQHLLLARTLARIDIRTQKLAELQKR